MSSEWARAHGKCLPAQTWLQGLGSNMSELARQSRGPSQLWLADSAIAVICSQGDKG